MWNKENLNLIQFNPYTEIKNVWFLLTIKSGDKYNSMTCSWGSTGVLWNKNVFNVFVRHSRYSHEFIESAEYFTISFFDLDKRSILQELGTKSGREIDKMNIKGITPIEIEPGCIVYEEAFKVITCKKLHKTLIDISSLEDIKTTFYPKNDMHDMYIGEILNIYTK